MASSPPVEQAPIPPTVDAAAAAGVVEAVEIGPDAAELARWTRVMTPALATSALHPGAPLRFRLDALPTEQQNWLFPAPLWAPLPPGAGGGPGGGPPLTHFSPSAFAGSISRERVMTTTAGLSPFLILAGVTLLVAERMTVDGGALLGVTISDWATNKMDAVGPGLPSCVATIQRVVMAAGGFLTSTELGGGSHVLVEWVRPRIEGGEAGVLAATTAGTLEGGGGGGGTPTSIDFEFMIIRRPVRAGQAATLVLHKMGVLNLDPTDARLAGAAGVGGGTTRTAGSTSGALTASAAANVGLTGGEVASAASPCPTGLYGPVDVVGSAALETLLDSVCTNGRHFGALVDLLEPPPPAFDGGVPSPLPLPPVLPYEITTSPCSMYAQVRLRSLALQLVPVAVPAALPLRLAVAAVGAACASAPDCSVRRRVAPPTAESASAASTDNGASASATAAGADAVDYPQSSRMTVVIAPAGGTAGLASAMATAVAATARAPSPMAVVAASEGSLAIGSGGGGGGGGNGNCSGSGSGSGSTGAPRRHRRRQRRLGGVPPPGMDPTGDAWARILRNREAARRSNEKRRLRRLAALASGMGVGGAPSVASPSAADSTAAAAAAATAVPVASPPGAARVVGEPAAGMEAALAAAAAGAVAGEGAGRGRVGVRLAPAGMNIPSAWPWWRGS